MLDRNQSRAVRWSRRVRRAVSSLLAMAVVAALLAVILAIPIGTVYVVYHFVSKYW